MSNKNKIFKKIKILDKINLFFIILLIIGLIFIIFENQIMILKTIAIIISITSGILIIIIKRITQNLQNKYDVIVNQEYKHYREKERLEDDLTNENEILINKNNSERKYILKNSQLSKIEKYFYNNLKNNLKDYDIQTQVPLSSIIVKNKVYENQFQNELNRIIDFGIFELKTMKPLLLIEINDSSHFDNKRKYRDMRVKEICDEAGIKIIAFWTAYENNEKYIINRVSNELNNN